MKKKKYNPHRCKEMEGFIFEFRFSQTRKSQLLWLKDEVSGNEYVIIHFPRFCPFCGERLKVATEIYGEPT